MTNYPNFDPFHFPNMKNPNQTAQSNNNKGYFFLCAVNESTPPCPAGRYLEVFQTDGTGKTSGDPVVSCYVADFETDEEAVAGLYREFLHPFGAAWESPEQYGNEFDAVKWLADYYGIKSDENGNV